MLGVILVLIAIVIILRSVTPINPVRVLLGPNAGPRAITEQTHKLGLDKPLPLQYLDYIGGLLHGDMGISVRTRRPVAADMLVYLPATAELAFYGLLLAVLIGGLLAVASAARWRGSGLLRALMLSAASAPPFLIALLGILLFYHVLGWLPATGRTSYGNAPSGPTRLLTVDAILAGRFDVFVDAIKHLALPAMCIAFGASVAIGRVLRSSLRTSLKSDYVRTARAKGLTELAVLRHHALRNSVGPAISMAGLQTGLMFAGVVVIEEIFAWPGIGSYTAESIPANDYAAIAAVTIILGATYVAINTLVDVSQAMADPRIRA